MKTIAFLMTWFFLNGCLRAADVINPEADYLISYHTGDYVKKMTVDLNNDGKTDFFFNYSEANPDPTIKISDDQAGGSLSWDVYVAVFGANTFTKSSGIEIDGALIQTAGLDLNPDQMYIGVIVEIGRLAIVSTEVKKSRSENSTVVYAYTWENDHFKRWKLTEFLVSQQNAIFDKYLKDDKRTHVTVQQIKP